ncbi:MAG: gluconeogenesis factor YvcK family protein, partial [Lentisphaerota bacterium]
DRSDLERSVESVLRASSHGLHVSTGEKETARRILRYDTTGMRVVVLGGGTGLSTVLGGNSQMPDWTERSSLGLKNEFARIDVVVCTTDDGGSTGELLKHLPMIGIGDLRKCCLSLVHLERLKQIYKLSEFQAQDLLGLIQKVINYRFPEAGADARILKDPVLAAPEDLRKICPASLRRAWARWGIYALSAKGLDLDPAAHCLGNLLLTASLFMTAGGRTGNAPGYRDIRIGIDKFSRVIGSTSGHLHPATPAPGQLLFRYTNGVEVFGQSKASRARRGFPVDMIRAEFCGRPVAGPAVLRALRNADLIVYAPGSLYTSIIPVLQVGAIVEAIRANRKALKILGANFWVQEGETDLSLRHEGREFLVSELIEAYDRNVPGGTDGLFHVVLSANLEHIPGHILRNYALEGKRPIHLDRTRVEAMGCQPVEATLFSMEHLRHNQVIHHDAGKFALAVRALLFADRGGRDSLKAKKPQVRSEEVEARHPAMYNAGYESRNPLLCEYYDSIRKALRSKHYSPESTKNILEELAWENRDILPEHFNFFRGVRVVRAAGWNRSTEWDNVLGYYDPENELLKLHEHLTIQPERLREDLLIALGESLLGNYIDSRKWIGSGAIGACSARCYEIKLRPLSRRKCFLDDRRLRTFLALARMVPDPQDPLVYRITINNHEGFLPSGLLFGLLYAWYLNNAYGGSMEYEMSLLRWPTNQLLPHQAQDRIRKQALVAFFCDEVFHPRRS